MIVFLISRARGMTWTTSPWPPGPGCTGSVAGQEIISLFGDRSLQLGEAIGTLVPVASSLLPGRLHLPGVEK